MAVLIRPAVPEDLDSVAAIYEAILSAQDQGRCTVGWIRGVYPTRETAAAALAQGWLYCLTDGGAILGSAIINRRQPEAYAHGAWLVPAETGQVLVLHTLVIHPDAAGRGYGRRFVAFYEAMARGQGCVSLRMDTNDRNLRARALYRSLGYREAGIVPTVFNGIPSVQLVLLEKPLPGAAAGASPYGPVELAGIRDTEALAELRLAFLRESHSALGEAEAEALRAQLPAYFQKHAGSDLFAYVIRSGGEIVSCAFLLVVEKPMSPAFPNGKTGILLNVYTRPAFRRMGLAGCILRRLTEDARTLQLSEIECKAVKAAVPLYRSVGFTDDVTDYHRMKWRDAGSRQT